ncbi:MAG: hypothetical protein HND53_06670 [Proteobacteria bacterium]|nr:hypothetical protein [Pseudomonadota bacterium]NOG60167.1 hypothetical protein [Pseudomonadota bacterium]
MIYKANVLFFLLLCPVSSLLAEQQTNESLPSLDFLEFIGEWETEEGEWLDPILLENEGLEEMMTDTKTENEI